MIDQAQIERFCKNECTAEERELVLIYFAEHPDELERYFPEEEAIEAQENLPSGIAEKWLDTIHEKAFEGRPVYRLLKKLAVAAAFLLLAGAGWYALQPKKNISSFQPVASQPSGITVRICYANHSRKDTTILLPDGSVIRLSPSASLWIGKSFGEDRERIAGLDGEAFFNVKHLSGRPFIVQSGEIATRDIGTTFRVRNRKEEDIISVRLYTGKVQVQTTVAENKKLPNKGLLDPGEEFLYSRSTRTASIRTTQQEELVRAGVGVKGMKMDQRPDWFMFEGQPLTQVLQQLSLYYGADIYYYPDDFKNSFFTGRFDKKDSLGKILQDLAFLNGLKTTQKDGKFIIKKK